jgi:hypothetical protein
LGAVFLVAWVALASTGWAFPPLINFQGMLTDPSGAPLDGNFDMTFRIYDAEIGGTELWSETQLAVPVTGGIYNVQLGAGGGLTTRVFELAGDTGYLEVEISGETLSPRQRITSVAYAFRAGVAQSVVEGGIESKMLATGAVTSTKIADGAVGTNQIGNGSIGSSDLGGSAVVTAAIANLAVTQAKIADSAINSAKVQDESLIAADLAPNSVGTSEIMDGSVTGAKIQDASITGADLAAGSVGTVAIADGSITSTDIQNESITSADLAPSSVGSSEIAANAVSAGKISFPLSYSGSDLNGGLVSMTNTANGSNGNFPAALYGASTGTPGSYYVIGVLGASPGLGAAGSKISSLPPGKIGVAGATDTGYGVAGYSYSSHGVYGESYNGDGVRGFSTGEGSADNGVYGHSNSTSYAEAGVRGHGTNGASGVYGSSESNTGRGVYGYASNNGAFENYGGYFQAAGEGGRGVYGYATRSGDYTNYGGYFETSGNYGAAVYAKHLASPNLYVALARKSTAITGYYKEGSLVTDPVSYGWMGTQSYGVYATNGFTGKYGGYFSAYGTSGIGLYATGPASGWAGVFRGNVQIQSIGGTPVMELGEGLDYAEGFNVSGSGAVGPGAVLIIDPESPGKLTLSEVPYDTKVAGIVAGANNLGSGVRLGVGKFDHNVALAGRVYCNVDAREAGVEPGDLLTTSATRGYAMKALDHGKAQGAILGKAMERLEKGQKGQILVLVTLQ